MPMLTVGDKFPEYKLTASVSTEKGKEFETISTKDNEGKWLVFYAYPKDFTFICPTEIVEFGKKGGEFADRDAVVLGGSTDNEHSHLAWRVSHPDLKDVKTPLVFITPAFAMQLGILHPGGRCRASRDVHRRPERHHPLGERQRPVGRPQRRRSDPRARRAAERRALPVQLAPGSADARSGVSIMSAVETLRARLPENARDTKLNLQSVLQAGTLTAAQRWGVAVASAAAARNAELLDAMLADAREEAGDAVIDDALAAASLMAMNNVYYRFRHMIGSRRTSRSRRASACSASPSQPRTSRTSSCSASPSAPSTAARCASARTRRP